MAASSAQESLALFRGACYTLPDCLVDDASAMPHAMKDVHMHGVHCADCAGARLQAVQ